jgi:hypothetical protein
MRGTRTGSSFRSAADLAAGALFDWSAGWARVTGPEKSTGVVPVTRRLKWESTLRHWPSRSLRSSMTVTPWDASALATFSGVTGVAPSVVSRIGSTYSWLSTSSPRWLRPR